MKGKTINGYSLQCQLGKGGMAEVWLAENALGKKAAVKLLLPKFCNDETVVARFQNEAKVMVKLDHPNIRQVYDLGDIDGRPCILMEYLEGGDLKALMKSGRRFTDEELRKWWDQITDALNYTHAKGIVHRDIKPSNIFLTKNGSIKLLDFGIAKIKESISMTQTGATMGTLMYMSPEQVQDSKHLGPQSDLYSLAVTFVHLLTGKAPYDTTTSNDYVIRKGIVEQELDLSVLPSSWGGFLKPYLAKNPADRPALRAFPAKPETSDISMMDEDENTVIEDEPSSRLDENTIVEPPFGDIPSIERHPSEQPILGKVEEHCLASQPLNKKRKKHGWIVPIAICGGLLLLYITICLGRFLDENLASVSGPVESVMLDGDLKFNVKGVSFVMKRVEGGTFKMGNDTVSFVWKLKEQGGSEFTYVPVNDDDDDAKPVHDVTLNAFYIGETEVTQALWNKLMWNNPSDQKNENYPVYGVSWSDCQKFIRKLNRYTGKNFRLPTEAEWEFAARGGNLSQGYRYAGSNDYDKVAWLKFDFHAVKMKQSNELGLYDMSGNVSEWCSDWYDSHYYSISPAFNPHGPSKGEFKVKRGKGRSKNFLSESAYLSSRYSASIEHQFYANRDYEDTGLRLVLSISE